MQIKYKKKQHVAHVPQTPRKHGLLKDLSEIKAVLDVEAQLMKALVKMAIARQAIGIRLSY